MLKPIQSILFATDLTPNCQQALEYTLALGTRFQATVYLLHVIESLPESVEGRLKNLLGRHKWEDIVHTQLENVRRSLTGKITTNEQVRENIRNFCTQVGIDETECSFQSREIIISEGDVVDEIIANAKENECDLIVLGARESLFTPTSVGTTIKSVLKNAKTAVMVVPTISADNK
jgi:nucleotide-binding universal stress UspA family protein